MLKITMTETTQGSYDGMHILEYKAGETYEVGDAHMPFVLAEVFVETGKAAYVQAPKHAPANVPTETKDDEGSGDSGSKTAKHVKKTEK